MSKSRKKQKFPTREELNLEESLKSQTINQEEESKMAEQTTNQTTAASAPAQTAPAQTAAAPAAQQPTAAPAETQKPAPAAPTAKQTSAAPQPTPAQAAAPAQPQAQAAPAQAAQPQAPAIQAAPAAPPHWSEKCSDPQVVAAMAVAQAFINAHPDQAESVGLLILNSTSPAEFQLLLNKKGNTTMNSNTTTTPAAPAVVPTTVNGLVPQIEVVRGEDRKSFSGWTTTEMVVVGLGAAALIGVSIWAVVATVKANRYKAALADAVSGNSGM